MRPRNRRGNDLNLFIESVSILVPSIETARLLVRPTWAMYFPPWYVS